MDSDVKLSVSCGRERAVVTLPPPVSGSQLHTTTLAALGAPAGSSLRLFHKGKVVVNDSTTLTLASGAKLMAMLTATTEREQIEAAQPERMRGFEEDDQRARTGNAARGPAARTSKAARSDGGSASRFGFGSLVPLEPLPPEARPSVGAASELLRSLATDPSILHLLQTHGWSVGALKELPPQGAVGVSASCLMGLNRNRGQEILLRLRTDDWAGLRPYSSIIPVLLHELTHNVHDDHDDDFKALCSLLTREYREHAATRAAGRTAADGPVAAPRVPEVEAPPEDRGYVLGGAASAAAIGAPPSAREAAAAAAAARHAGAAADAREPGERGRVPSWVTAGATCSCGLCGLCTEVAEPEPESAVD